MKLIKHIPDVLAQVVHGLMSKRKILQVIAKIDGQYHVKNVHQKENGCLVVEFRFPTFYLFYRKKFHKRSVKKKLKMLEKFNILTQIIL